MCICLWKFKSTQAEACSTKTFVPLQLSLRIKNRNPGGIMTTTVATPSWQSIGLYVQIAGSGGVHRGRRAQPASLRYRDLFHRGGCRVLCREKAERAVKVAQTSVCDFHWTFDDAARLEFSYASGPGLPTETHRLKSVLLKTMASKTLAKKCIPRLRQILQDLPVRAISSPAGISRFRGASTGCSAGRRGRGKRRRCCTRRFTRRTCIRAWTRCCCGARFRSLRRR